MKIAFDITTEEADIIATQYSFDDTKGDKEEFVLELFKEFGRTCIISCKNNEISLKSEAANKAEIDTAKSDISF